MYTFTTAVHTRLTHRHKRQNCRRMMLAAHSHTLCDKPLFTPITCQVNRGVHCIIPVQECTRMYV